MFDDLETSENKTSKADGPSDGERGPSVGLERWAHFPALLAFGALIIGLHSHPWGWHIAISSAYTVYVFWFALGSGKKDSDDVIGDQEIAHKVGILIIPHLIVLAILLPAISEWFHLKPRLPTWATQEGGRGSLWDMFGWLSLAIAGMAQGFWMAKKIQRKFGNSSESE